MALSASCRWHMCGFQARQLKGDMVTHDVQPVATVCVICIALKVQPPMAMASTSQQRLGRSREPCLLGMRSNQAHCIRVRATRAAVQLPAASCTARLVSPRARWICARASRTPTETCELGTAGSTAAGDHSSGCVCYSKAVTACIVSAASEAACGGCAAPQPAHLLMAVLQHPAAADAVLPILSQHQIILEGVRTVLNIGMLLQQEQSTADTCEGALISPLHDGAPLPEATKTVLHTALGMAMYEGSDVVGPHHLFKSLCDDIMPLDVRYCPMAYAIYQLLGENSVTQVMSPLVGKGAAQLGAAVQADDAVPAPTPPGVKQTVQLLTRVLPALQTSADVADALASYERVGLYPDAAARQQLLKHALQNACNGGLSLEQRVQLKLWLTSYAVRGSLEIQRALQEIDFANQPVPAHVSCYVQPTVMQMRWPQVLQLLRSLKQLQEHTGTFTSSTWEGGHSWGMDALEPGDLWPQIYRGVYRGSISLYDQLDAARCMHTLKACMPVDSAQLAPRICRAKQFTDREKAAAIHGLLRATCTSHTSNAKQHTDQKKTAAVDGLLNESLVGGLGIKVRVDDRIDEWVITLLQKAGDSIRRQLPTSTWWVLLPPLDLQQMREQLSQLKLKEQQAQGEVVRQEYKMSKTRYEPQQYCKKKKWLKWLEREVSIAQDNLQKPQEALATATGAYAQFLQLVNPQLIKQPALLCTLLQTISQDKAKASPQLCYDAYSQVLIQLPNLSLTDAVQVLDAAQAIGSPPPSLLPKLREAAAALLKGADFSADGSTHQYLTIMKHYSSWSDQAGQQGAKQQNSEADGSSTASSQPPADLVTVHKRLALQVVNAFQAGLQAEEPVSLQVLGQQVAKGSVSAEVLARQLLQHHTGKQCEATEVLAFLCMAVPPASITNLQDMAACLVAMYHLKGEVETAMVATWLNSAKGVLGRLLWQTTQRGWATTGEPAVMACLSAWWLLRPADKLALGSLPSMLFFQTQPEETPSPDRSAWGLIQGRMLLTAASTPSEAETAAEPEAPEKAAALLWGLSSIWGSDMSQPVKAVSDEELQALTEQLSHCCTVEPCSGLIQLAATACQLRQLGRASTKDVFVGQLGDAATNALFTYLIDNKKATECIRLLDAEQLQMLSTLVLQLLPATSASPAATADASAAELRMTAALHVLLNEMEARMQNSDACTSSNSTSSSPQQGSSTAVAAYRSPPLNKHQQWCAVISAIKGDCKTLSGHRPAERLDSPGNGPNIPGNQTTATVGL